MFNLRQKIAQRLEKQHSIRQQRREGFSDHNDAMYAEVKRQLGNQTPGDSALPRQMPIDTHVGGLGGLADSQNRLQEMETSLDLSQTSIDWDLMFLDLDGWNHGSLDNARGPSTLKSGIAYRSTWRILRAVKLGRGRRGCRRKPVAGRMVRIPRGVLKGSL